MAQKTLILSGISLAVALAFAPAVQAAPGQQDSCTKNFTQAGVAAATDMKAASILVEKAGDCCATDLNTSEVQSLIKDIKVIVASASTAVTKGGDKDDAGKLMSSALACAGQPAIVAVDPTLYSSVLADSANFAELARDENADGGLSKDVQFARLPGSLPNNNQQPTVSIEQK